MGLTLYFITILLQAIGILASPCIKFLDFLLVMHQVLNNFKYLSNDIGCVSLQVEDALPHDDDDWMIHCMQFLKRINQKKYKSKLRMKKRKLERLKAKLTKRLNPS